MKNFIALALSGIGASLLLVAGCTPSSDSKAPDTASSTPKSPVVGGKHEDMLVGLVFDKGGLGDKSFNDSANRGLEAAKSKLGIKTKTVDSKSDSEYQTNLEALAEGGAQLVIGVGISMQKAVELAAKKYPKVKFGIVDAPVDAPNVRSMVFKEEEGSFMVGYLAALMTKTHKLGFVGGMDFPLIRKFQFGYQAGARLADPKIEFLPAKFTGDWVNVDLGKENAKSLYGGGADIVYAAAGRAGLGVISAAAETKNYAIGVDSDQDEIEKGSVLTSMIKHVDVAVEQTITDTVNGSFSPGTKVYDLKAEGVGLSPMTYTKDAIGADKLAKVEAIKQKIISGAIKVPTTESEFNATTATAPSQG